MALRVKSTWHRSERNRPAPKTLADHGRALAFIAWRLALDKARNLHGQRFRYRSDGQRLAVICEYLAFQVQLADRLAQRRMDDARRAAFVTALARRVADHVQDNACDLLGPGDYRAGFIDTLNERAAQYAETAFTEAGPGFSFVSLLGQRVQRIMGEDQVNRWVLDQVAQLDAPDLAATFSRALAELLAHE